MPWKELFSFLIDSKPLYERFEKQVKPNHVLQVIQTNANTLEQIETFRFKDENDYAYEISLESFFAYSQIIDTPDSFIVHLFHRKKIALLSLLNEVKLSPDAK